MELRIVECKMKFAWGVEEHYFIVCIQEHVYVAAYFSVVSNSPAFSQPISYGLESRSMTSATIIRSLWSGINTIRIKCLFSFVFLPKIGELLCEFEIDSNTDHIISIKRLLNLDKAIGEGLKLLAITPEAGVITVK